MRRYWVDKDAIAAEHIVLSGNTFHHIFHVCRQELGSKFEVLCGDGKAYFVCVETVEKRSAIAKIVETREIPKIPKPHIVLALSVPKFQKAETILEKAVELGVSRVVPFTSDYSFVKSLKTVDEKSERWIKIIRAATEQTGRGEQMVLSPATALDRLLEEFNRNSNAEGLFSYEGESSSHIRATLTKIKESKPQELWVFVGSEGGFSNDEADLFRKQGLEPTTLGNQVLRVETACLALVSVIKYEMDLMQ